MTSIHVLDRVQFFAQLKHYCQVNGKPAVIALIEVNNAADVARLLSGYEAENQLIQWVERSLVNGLSSLNVIFGCITPRQFAVLLTGYSGVAEILFQRLVDSLNNACFDYRGRRYYPRITVGISVLTTDVRRPEMAFMAAEQALYQARRGGGGKVFTVKPDDPGLKRYLSCLTCLPKLRAGLRQHEFVLYAQPMVPINDGDHAKKAEILLRHRSPEGVIGLPATYLQAANAFNISRDVDFYVLEHLCRYLRDKKDDTLYSINVSGASVRDPYFSRQIQSLLDYHGMAPERLCFEITETVADKDYLLAHQLMLALKALGVRLSLDDIGVGSSNLANLPRFPVDYFKIDGTYLPNLLDHEYCEQVVRFIHGAAKAYNKQSIAEHIESPLQLDKIKQIGVDFAQGFYTGSPRLLYDPRQGVEDG